jgi:hypothetical protein
VDSDAGVLDFVSCYNPNATVAFVQIFDIVGAVTLGTSTPKTVLAIGATSTGGATMMNLGFANAIKSAATTTATGSTGPTTDLVCSFGSR